MAAELIRSGEYTEWMWDLIISPHQSYNVIYFNDLCGLYYVFGNALAFEQFVALEKRTQWRRTHLPALKVNRRKNQTVCLRCGNITTMSPPEFDVFVTCLCLETK